MDRDVMKGLILLLLASLLTGTATATPVSKPPPIKSALVADEGLRESQRYLLEHLKAGQFDAVDTLLASLSLGQREFLLYQLIRDLHHIPATALLQSWVQTQSTKAPQWLVEGEVDGFLMQLPAYDFPAEARLLLTHWQQQNWQAQYRQALSNGSFEWKSIYNSRNPLLAQQQQALLQAIAQLPAGLLYKQAQALGKLNIFLPDNRLLSQLLLRTGEPSLFLMLWRQPVDDDSLVALKALSSLQHGETASDLLIAATKSPKLKRPALKALSQLSPLPIKAQDFLLAELGNSQYGGLVASLLLEVDEPRLLVRLADELTRMERRPNISLLLAPNTGTTGTPPGL